MNKLFIISSMLLISLSTTLFAFDQDALDRLYAGDTNMVAADFNGANISYAPNATRTYWNVNFSGADFRNANLYMKVFEACDFSGANFSGANLHGAQLRNSHFTGANFSNINGENLILSGSIVDTKFSGSNLKQAQFMGNPNDATQFKFANTNLAQTRFYNFNIVSAEFKGALFDNTKFEKVKINASLKSFLKVKSIVDAGITWVGGSPKNRMSGVKKLTPNTHNSLLRTKMR